MNCTAVYESALTLIGEPAHVPAIDDYKKRAPSLLGVVHHRFVRISEALTGNKIPRSSLHIASLEDEFPLDESLFYAASLALASLLILDEQPVLAAILDERAEGSAAAAAKDAVTVTPTKEVYPG